MNVSKENADCKMRLLKIDHRADDCAQSKISGHILHELGLSRALETVEGHGNVLNRSHDHFLGLQQPDDVVPIRRSAHDDPDLGSHLLGVGVVRGHNLATSITTEDDLGAHGNRMLSGHAPMMLRERDLRRVIELK